MDLLLAKEIKTRNEGERGRESGNKYHINPHYIYVNQNK